MKKVSFCMTAVLVPALALAQPSTPAPKVDSTAQTTPTPTAPAAAAPAATATAKADDKKDGEKKEEKKEGGLANAVQARTPEEQANQSGFQVAVSLDHWLGGGTFVDPALYAYLAANLTVSATYLFGIGGKRFAANLTGRAMFEYTMPDNNNARRFEPFDTRLGVSAPALIRTKDLGPFSGLAISPSVALTLPTSFVSLNNGVIAGLSVGATMSTRLKMFDFQARAGAGHTFVGQTVIGTRANAVPRAVDGPPVLLTRPGENMAAIIGNNTQWTVSAGGQVQARVTDSFMLYVGYTYIRQWRYPAQGSTATADEFTPKAVDSNGNPIAVTGAGSFDRFSAFIGGSYQFNDHYSVDLGISNFATPLINVNGKWVPRFPFLPFGTWADNTFSAYFTLTAAY